MYKDGFNMLLSFSSSSVNSLTIRCHSVIFSFREIEIESDDEIELRRPHEIKCTRGI